MSVSILNQVIALLYEVRSSISNTGGCVIAVLDQTISNLEALRGGEYSDTELSAMILEELDLLFKTFPETQRLLQSLAEL